jgi:hypothetical protein
MVQGVLSSKKKGANKTTRKKSKGKLPDTDSESSFIDLKGDIKIRMSPFLVDKDGKYPGEPPSPSDEASRERKLQRQRRYEALRREFSAEDPPPAPPSPPQSPPSEPLPRNTLKQQQQQQQQQHKNKQQKQQMESSSDSLYGELDWDAEEAELNKQAEATKREMAKLQRKRNMLRFAKQQEQLKKSFTEQLQVAKQQTERELQSRISAMRVERKERVGKVER